MALSQTALSSLQLFLYSNQLADRLLASAEEKPYSLCWPSLQAIVAYVASADLPIASVVLAGAPDWVFAESSSAVELMD